MHLKIIGELRIGASSEVNDHMMTKWYHLRCFKVPRKFKKSMDTFVLEDLTDQTTDLILSNPEKRKEIIEALSTSGGDGRKRKSDSGPAHESHSAEDRVAKVEQDFETWKQDEEVEARPKKKQSLSDEDVRRVEAYDIYRLMRNEDLKSVLRWNRQIISGTHPVLLVRVLDGHMYGRLGRCTLCGVGKLRLEDDGGMIHCHGIFDEETHVRYPCSAKYSPEQAPRLKPWFLNKPSEEEEATMDAQTEDMKVSAQSTEAIEDTKSNLSSQALTLEWNLSSHDGIKKAATGLLQLCKDSGTPIDLPEDPTTARMEVGKIIMENKDKAADQVLQLVIDRFGLKTVNEENKQAKLNAIKGSCVNSANAALIAAFTELSQLCFKEKDSIRGASYSKVASALYELPYEITADNALGLGKGKTKVRNIGQSTAEKILEFVTTGTIQVLEEKRAIM